MKKLCFPLIPACFVLANLVMVSCAGPGEKVDLKLRLQEGKTYKLRMVNEQNTKLTAQGREMQMSQKMAMEFAFDAQKVDEAGDATIKVTFQRISTEIEGPMGKISYDSANPTEAGHPMVKAFALMAGRSYTMVISDKGEVKKVDGIKEIMTSMLDSLDIPDERMKETMKKQFENMFGEKATVEMTGQWFGMFPEQPVGVSDSWSKTVFESSRMPLIVENKWTLKERKGGNAVLAAESVIKSNPDAEPTEMGQMKVTVDMSGEQSGTYEIDESTGWIVSSRITQTISGEQRIEGGPAQEGSMTIPISMESVITLEPL